MTSAPSAHRDHWPPQPLPTGSWSLGGCGHPGPQFTQLLTLWWDWRRGQLSSQPSCSLGTPPTRHTWSPPICISKKICSICFHSFTLQLTMGGQRPECQSFKPPPPRGGWGACVPFRDRELIELSHLSLRARSVLLSGCPWGDYAPQAALTCWPPQQEDM